MRAKKSLGQNFLKSEAALRKIVEAGEIKPTDTILEIGPGKGALTEKLLARSSQLVAVEKDRELVEFLKEKFKKEIEEGKLILVHDDILDFNIESYKLRATSYKLIANIPYNITGAILRKFLSAERQPERMVLLVQREVVQRIMARGNPSTSLGVKESILSISVKAYGTPKLIMKVPARYFSPAPKVDSAVISIKNISRKFFYSPLEEYPQGEVDGFSRNLEEKFWKIVKAGFAHKRKLVKGNLKGLVPDEILAGLGDKRAENLTLFEWISLLGPRD